MSNTSILEKKLSKKNNKNAGSGLELSNCSIFFDFDNTITSFDILDEIIERFSVDDSWLRLEEDWLSGRIGSKDCLEGQLRSVRVTKKALYEYLSKIEVDSYFKILLSIFKDNKIKPIIVSDSFYPIIDFILKNNGIRGIKIYSNQLKFSKDRLNPEFPFTNKLCPDCANCKKNHLEKTTRQNSKIIYIGDGRSDICPAESADLVFAKASLLEYFKNNKRRCIEFKDLSDVYRYFQEAGNGKA